MVTNWDDKNVSENFNEYSDVLENLLGYSFVFNYLDLDNKNIKKVLDYGCGPGKVSERIAKQYDKLVVAVDESEEMIEIANETRSNQKIIYKRIYDDNLSFIESSTIDAAILSFVILNHGNKTKICNMLNEIYRVLKPNACLVILDTEPTSVGINFSTFKSGETGKTYMSGDEREAWLFIPNGDFFPLKGYHWNKEDYRSMLTTAKFKFSEEIKPVIKDIPIKTLEKHNYNIQGMELNSEWNIPPFFIMKVFK